MGLKLLAQDRVLGRNAGAGVEVALAHHDAASSACGLWKNSMSKAFASNMIRSSEGQGTGIAPGWLKNS
jgi:hypothetical protein